jgi:hypothetical protein
MIEHHQRLVAAVVHVAPVDGHAFELTRIARLAAHDVGQAFRIAGDRKRNRIVLVFRPHGDGGHGDDLVGIDRAGLMILVAADHDAVLALFHNVQKHIRVLLLMRRERPVAFRVGHGPAAGEVVFLYVRKIFQKALVVFRAVF